MEIFPQKNLIENCEKNYKQTCSKQKIANVSSVNECHKIDTSSRVRKTEHMGSRQNVPGWWHTEQLLLHVRYTNSKRSPLLNAISQWKPCHWVHIWAYFQWLLEEVLLLLLVLDLSWVAALVSSNDLKMLHLTVLTATSHRDGGVGAITQIHGSAKNFSESQILDLKLHYGLEDCLLPEGERFC